MHELLTVDEMAEADRRTIEAGTPGYTLMKNAGRQVFDVIRRRWSRRPVLVICGPGNNGGDGYVVASDLADAGWPVQLVATIAPEKLGGDASLAARDCQVPVLTPEEIDWQFPALIVDALFGAGLSRPITDDLATIVQQINVLECPVVAIDIPSGIDGNTGKILAAAVKAQHTVTFFRAKPGHFLHPGKAQCGEVNVSDIGIRDDVLVEIKPKVFLNDPDKWSTVFPWPDATAYKFTRGSGYICSGGPYESGAARLSALAALRSGAGLVTLISPEKALTVNACHLTEVMLKRGDSGKDLEDLLTDSRVTAALIGPGAGVGEGTASKVLCLLASGANVILDADALMSFERRPNDLFDMLRPGDVLTPHEGEFNRLFGGPPLRKDRLTAIKDAAERAGCIVLLKGDDTVIASPGGRITINANGSPWLATAGSGDVLAGIITGLIAQGMPSFEAASAAAWLHSEMGRANGPGTIAGDLLHSIPKVLRKLYDRYRKPARR